MSKCDEEDFLLFAHLARQLWFRRNEYIHNEIFTHPNQILQQAVCSMEDFKTANVTEIQVASDGGGMSTGNWVAPPLGWSKVNWDAALNRQKGVIGLGVVVRDNEGKVRAAKSTTRQGLLDPTDAEAVAAYESAIFCKDQGCTHVILEGDAKNIVEAVKDNGPNSSRRGQLIDDIRTTLHYFTDRKIEYVSRRSNGAAYRLAKNATNGIIDRNWLEETPECIYDIITIEKSSPSVI